MKKTIVLAFQICLIVIFIAFFIYRIIMISEYLSALKYTFNEESRQLFKTTIALHSIMLTLDFIGAIFSGLTIYAFTSKKCLFFDRSVREEWHAFKERRAARKAQKTAEQKQARIAELENELSELKKDGE